jgi:hypothetical protein
VRFFLNKYFVRQLDDYDLGQDYIREVLRDIAQGRSISLGHKLYKIRAARRGEGKSGSFRNIFFWEKDEFIVFCYLFPKNRRADLSVRNSRALRILADEYDRLTKEDLAGLVSQKNFLEVAQ